VAASRAFAEPRAQTSGGDAGRDEDSEELDLDRRAPLAMRIEVAPEPAAPAARSGSAGSGGTATRRPTPPPAGEHSAQPRASDMTDDEDPSLRRTAIVPAAPKPTLSPGLIAIVAFVAIAIAVMVIMSVR
jgi:hypothetical protein